MINSMEERSNDPASFVLAEAAQAHLEYVRRRKIGWNSYEDFHNQKNPNASELPDALHFSGDSCQMTLDELWITPSNTQSETMEMDTGTN